MNRFIVRIHLVRHGETIANREGFVLGQRESNLTEEGIAQALSLGELLGERRSQFWRVFSSDYERTQRTARLVLRGGAGNCDDGNSGVMSAMDATIVPDKRLRERAKGVREGRPKTIPYEDALRLHLEEHGQNAEFPLLESEADVWNRVQNWIDEVVTDASENKRLSNSRKTRRDMYDVLAVSHSATIRTAVNRLVGGQLPSSIVRGSGGKEGAADGMLVVANTSMTIIDINVDITSHSGNQPAWTAELVELTNTDHLQNAKKI